MPNMQFVKQLIEFLFPSCTVQVFTTFQDCKNIMFDTELAKYRCFLWKIAQPKCGALVHRQRCKILAVEQNATLV